ncbi:hypothetical protein AEYBE204_06025 [Asticcacaulis sp. YBE204]|nr:hypothetical protein AEYBE204_06025 [Asticcacaulis sp. YBE204]
MRKAVIALLTMSALCLSACSTPCDSNRGGSQKPGTCWPGYSPKGLL